MLLYGAMSTIQGKIVLYLTNSKVRREGRQRYRRTPTVKPEPITYSTPNADSLIDSLPHGQRPKIIDSFRQNFLAQRSAGLTNKVAGSLKTPQ
jgi:hypothetical protein